MNDPRCHRVEATSSRRDFLFSAGLGLGAMAFSDLLAKDIVVPAAGTPLQPGVGLIKPRAKRVIFLFMEGGPSQMDLYDPKPLLNKLAGQRLPDSFGSVKASPDTKNGATPLAALCHALLNSSEFLYVE